MLLIPLESLVGVSNPENIMLDPNMPIWVVGVEVCVAGAIDEKSGLTLAPLEVSYLRKVLDPGGFLKVASQYSDR